MKNEIRNLKDLKGKTIVETKKSNNDLWIKFFDDTFVVISISDITKGFDHPESEVDIFEFEQDKTDYTLVDLGLITEDEYEKACK